MYLIVKETPVFNFFKPYFSATVSLFQSPSHSRIERKMQPHSLNAIPTEATTDKASDDITPTSRCLYVPPAGIEVPSTILPRSKDGAFVRPTSLHPGCLGRRAVEDGVDNDNARCTGPRRLRARTAKMRQRDAKKSRLVTVAAPHPSRSPLPLSLSSTQGRALYEPS